MKHGITTHMKKKAKNKQQGNKRAMAQAVHFKMWS